jgi:hypothetical protein
MESQAFGAQPSRNRALSRGTLAAGGGWTLIPTQGGATTKDAPVWI